MNVEHSPGDRVAAHSGYGARVGEVSGGSLPTAIFYLLFRQMILLGTKVPPGPATSFLRSSNQFRLPITQLARLLAFFDFRDRNVEIVATLRSKSLWLEGGEFVGTGWNTTFFLSFFFIFIFFSLDFSDYFRHFRLFYLK